MDRTDLVLAALLQASNEDIADMFNASKKSVAEVDNVTDTPPGPPTVIRSVLLEIIDSDDPPLQSVKQEPHAHKLPGKFGQNNNRIRITRTEWVDRVVELSASAIPERFQAAVVAHRSSAFTSNYPQTCVPGSR
ncbi:hypothetical protein C8R45DRAFT_934154 [Mycena sanguinolenta]|nr:hypothetical protein C8R45DRAFT_934154 [Mycena sanguinolenta]